MDRFCSQMYSQCLEQPGLVSLVNRLGALTPPAGPYFALLHQTFSSPNPHPRPEGAQGGGVLYIPSSPFYRGLIVSFTRSFINSLVHSIPHLSTQVSGPRARLLRLRPDPPTRPQSHPLSRPAPFMGQSGPADRAGPGCGRGLAPTLPLAAPAAPETRRGAVGFSRARAAPWRFLPRRACLGRSSAALLRAARRPPPGWGECAGHRRMCAEHWRLCRNG